MPVDIAPDERRLTRVEQRLDQFVHRLLDRTSSRAGGSVSRFRHGLVEFLVFGVKQAWACVFGVAMLGTLVAARLWYPEGAALARSDFITITAIAIQILMLVFRLESGRELWVILLFHLTGTVIEVFKTDVGSWSYDHDGILRIAGVPLYSGFMYAAVGSYMVRVYRLTDMRFVRYPRRWLTAICTAAIYINFFTHHYIYDFRWVLLGIVGVLWGPTFVHYRIWRREPRMPLLLGFGLVALFIWIAENIATWAGAWFYPNQALGWQPVSVSKLISWFLLMIISFVLVTWIYPPKSPSTGQASNLSLGDELERVRLDR